MFQNERIVFELQRYFLPHLRGLNMISSYRPSILCAELGTDLEKTDIYP